MSSSQEYSPRVAVVTGGAQGIGEAIALRLADDGLDIAVFDVPSKREQLDSVANAIEKKGRRSLVLVGDVSVEADVIAMVEKTVEVLGCLDVMVSNAGIFKPQSILDVTVEEWDKTLAVNTRGMVLCFKHAARQMIEQGRGGRIIGAASAVAKQALNASLSAYCASKFAVRGLAQCAALELRKHNITVNTYAPGAIETPMSELFVSGEPTPEFRKRIRLSPDSTIAPPSAVAALVSFLVKPEARFTSGQCLLVNGGNIMD